MAIWIEFSPPLKKTIKVRSASFSMNSQPSAGISAGIKHTSQVQDFSFTKYNDAFSVMLAKYFSKGNFCRK